MVLLSAEVKYWHTYTQKHKLCAYGYLNIHAVGYSQT